MNRGFRFTRLLGLAAGFVLLFAFAGQAAAQGYSNLRLFAADGQPFSLSLNGQSRTDARAEHRINELLPGEHKLEVYVGEKRVLKRSLKLAGGQVSDYELLLVGKKPEIRLAGTRPVGATSQEPTVGSAQPPHLNNKPRDGRFYTGRSGCGPPMDEGSFARVLLQVSQPLDDPTRIAAARRAVENRCLAIDQVVQLCRMFQSDRTRLDFARFAYPYTYEQEYFLDIGETLSFDGSREELEFFLSQQAR